MVACEFKMLNKNNKIIRLILFFLLIVFINSSYAEAAVRRAFVVGVNNYNPKFGLKKLSAPRTDAEQIRDALQKRNIEFIVDYVKRDQVKNKEAFINALNTFLDRISPGDSVLFYFSGVGYHIKGKGNYFLFEDAKSQQAYIKGLKSNQLRGLDSESAKRQAYEEWLVGVAVSEQYIEQQLLDRNLGKLIIIADASRRFSKQIPKLEIPNKIKPGTFRLYSAGSGQVSLNSEIKLPPKKNDTEGKKRSRRNKKRKRTTSLFTRVFLNQINVPGQTLEIMAAQVKISVRNIARDRDRVQIPDFAGHKSNKKFYFWQGDTSELRAFCITARAEFDQLKYAVLSGSVGRDQLEKKTY